MYVSGRGSGRGYLLDLSARLLDKRGYMICIVFVKLYNFDSRMFHKRLGLGYTNEVLVGDQ